MGGGNTAVQVQNDTVGVIVATKLLPPPVRQERVRRPRLLDRLDGTGRLCLTLLSAPAGWGKTTVLADWYEQRPRGRDAWLTLDASDNDPTRFWSGVVAALRRIVPGVGGTTLATLGLTGTGNGSTILAPLINDLAELDEPCTLVLDDYHVIVNGAIHTAMEYLVANAPATLRLVVAGRADPPLPLSQLRARGELCELRARDLFFTRPDTEAFLNDVLHLGLAPADVTTLWERTEGWAGGLCLAALSLQDRADRSGFIAAFAGNHRHVVDYLGAEVLDRQSEDVRRFLLLTSILDRLTGPLCDAVVDTVGSRQLLENLERSNLFLQPLDTTREWYRYHHLFRDLLFHELRRAEPEVIPELHRRAATWHRQTGSAEAAIRHSTAVGDFASAADLITECWYAFLQRGQVGTVAEWLDAFPPDALAADPRLCLTRGVDRHKHRQARRPRPLGAGS